MPEEVVVNHGVKEGRKPEDYVAGVNSPLGFIVVMPDGNWDSYLPSDEEQYAPGVPGSDKMECVTQAHHHQVATRLNWMIAKGLLPAKHLKFLQDYGYINEKGSVDFNERMSATSNETMPDGNWLYKVADDARKVGLFPKGIIADDKSLPWNVYYDKKILTPERMAIGKKFLEFFELPYEWIQVSVEELQKQLQHAPLQVVIPGHSVEEYHHPGQVKYFDSYIPTRKSISFSQLSSAMKIIINPINTGVDMSKKFKIQQGSKLGILILEGFSGTLLYEDDFAEYQKLLQISGIDPNAMPIVIPTGKFFRINDHNKLGVLISEGYSGTVIFENNWVEYQQLLKITGVPVEAPTINVP